MHALATLSLIAVMMSAPPPPVTSTLPISSFTGYFTPISLTNQFSLPLPIASAFGEAGHIAATLMVIATPQIVTYYLGARIGILAFLWLIGFVMEKLGKPLPPNDNSVVVLGRRSPRVNALPRLPPSGLGRSRSGRW